MGSPCLRVRFRLCRVPTAQIDGQMCKSNWHHRLGSTGPARAPKRPLDDPERFGEDLEGASICASTTRDCFTDAIPMQITGKVGNREVVECLLADRMTQEGIEDDRLDITAFFPAAPYPGSGERDRRV